MPSVPLSGSRRLERASLGVRRHLGWSFAALMLVGCSPESLSYTDTDVIITVRDVGRSYAPYQTYALPEVVVDLCELSGLGSGGQAGAAGAAGASTDSDCEPLKHRYDQAIFDSIRDNLDELGFTERDPEDDPDVLILTAGIAQESWYVYYPYCDYWYGYCFEYMWSPTAISYPAGTLAMYMVSWREADHINGTVPVIWLGAVSGLVSGSHELDENRIESSIDQAFAQSRYLGEGK